MSIACIEQRSCIVRVTSNSTTDAVLHPTSVCATPLSAMSRARAHLGKSADLDSFALLLFQLSDCSRCSVSRARGPDHGELLHEGLSAILQPEIRYICLNQIVSHVYGRVSVEEVNLVDVVPSRTWQVPVLPKPMPLNLHLEPALEDRVPRELGEGTLREFVDL